MNSRLTLWQWFCWNVLPTWTAGLIGALIGLCYRRKPAIDDNQKDT
jgi:hypothetical protein